MRRRIAAATDQHRTAARRLLAMRRKLRQVVDELGASDRVGAMRGGAARCCTFIRSRGL